MNTPKNEGNGRLVVLAIGGNSLITDAEHETVRDQYENCLRTCGHIARLVQHGYRVVVTHGNGPQVGFILRRAELASSELHMVPLDSCGADTQGAIGYQIQMALYNCMRDWERPATVATVVTQVLVDRNDPDFQAPSKPIGSFMDAAAATERQRVDGWHVVEDAGRGYRRVVPSPQPIEILELEAVRKLVEGGVITVTVGGGGIPVARADDGTLLGVEAVIDKDRASGLLARELGADILLISTAVEKAFLRFGTPQQEALQSMTVAEARRYIAEGHFAPGSMRPKIDAMANFVEQTGKFAVLTDPNHVLDAIRGKTGTRIVP